MRPHPVDLSAVPGAGGVVWSTSPGFHANLVVLEPLGAIGAHRNDDLEVLIVVLAGGGRLTVDEGTADLHAATAVVVPRGTVRAVVAGDEGLRYLTVHAERGGLAIGTNRRADHP